MKNAKFTSYFCWLMLKEKRNCVTIDRTKTVNEN